MDRSTIRIIVNVAVAIIGRLIVKHSRCNDTRSSCDIHEGQSTDHD